MAPLYLRFTRRSARPYQVRYGDRGHGFVVQFGILEYCTAGDGYTTLM